MLQLAPTRPLVATHPEARLAPIMIDIHTHILPAHLPDFAARYGPPGTPNPSHGYVQLDHYCPGCARMLVGGKAFREITANNWDPAVRLAECDAAGVHMQVLSTVPVLFAYWAPPAAGLAVAQYLNDHIAGCVQAHPQRFMGLGTVPLQDTDLAIAELERCMAMGLRGVEIGTNINGQNLSEPRFFPFFEACARLGAAVFIHPWDMMGEQDMQRYWLPWLVGMPAETTRAACSLIFGGVFARLPSLRVAFAHGGGSLAATLGRIRHGWRVRPDLVALHSPDIYEADPARYLGRFWVDSLTHDPHLLRYLMQLVGEDKVALGTDYPYPLGEWEPSATDYRTGTWQPGSLIRGMQDLPESTRNKLLELNARTWLGV